MTRDDAKADMFDSIERFCAPRRRDPTIRYLSPAEFETAANLGKLHVHQTGSSLWGPLEDLSLI